MTKQEFITILNAREQGTKLTDVQVAEVLDMLHNLWHFAHEELCQFAPNPEEERDTIEHILFGDSCK